MRVTEQTGPSIADMTEQAQLQNSLLYRDLCAFANSNPGFQRGSHDFFSLRAIEIETSYPEREDEDEDDDREDADIDTFEALLHSTVQLTYNFQVERKRIWVEKAQKAELRFMFSVAATHEGTLMPPHLAEQELGLPAKEAVREIGLVRERHEQLFTYLSDIHSLSVCESITYESMDSDDEEEAEDNEDNIIMQVCSCSGEEVVYVRPHCDEDEDDDGDTLAIDETEIAQLSPSYAQEKRTSDAIVMQDIDLATEEWVQTEALGAAVDVYDYLRKVLMARSCLQTIRQAMLRQVSIG